MPLIVGLTGGIGSGKSFAADLFAQHGVPIIDADQISHALSMPGAKAFAPIIGCFGSSYLSPSGQLDRAKLRHTVFKNSAALAKLTAILHPLIRAELEAQTQAHISAPYLIHLIPLLVENLAWRKRVHRILVVDCAQKTQIARTMQRSGLSRAEVLAIMAQQVPRPRRLSYAHEVLDNREQMQSTLPQQVVRLHCHYLALAQRIKTCDLDL